MNKIWNCLPRSPSRESAIKCLFQGHNRMVRVGFEQRQLKQVITKFKLFKCKQSV